ncbi:MAG: chromosome segregation protein SMC, partial [Oscillospiraceae bacterium]|nr:chromosome segregation protein SMC [Oscillospiraceae bacterium]
PDDRRRVIEEASGIVKFKWRKEETLKKIENYENNLIRLSDIITTYEDRIEPLRVESEKAKYFVDLSNELKQKDIDVKVYEVEKILETLRSVIKFLDEKNKLLSMLEMEKISLKSCINEIDLNLCDIEREIDEKLERSNALKEKIRDIKSSILIFNEKIENIKNNLTDIQNSILEKGLLKEEKIKSIERVEDEKKAIEQEYKDLSERLFIYEDELNIIQNNINLNDNSHHEKIFSINKIKDELSRKKEKIFNLKSKEKYDKERIISINLSRDVFTKRLNEIEDDVKKLNRVLENKNEALNELNGKVLNCEKSLKVLNEERKKLNDDLNNLYREKSKLAANLHVLENLEDHYEGYNKASKSIIEYGRKIGDEFSSALGDVIKVKEGLETAIETSLGNSISDIIVEDESRASFYIDHLKKSKSGRVTFLPISMLISKRINISKEVSEMEGFIGVASDLVDYEKKYEASVVFSLCRVLIVKDMNSAISIAKKTKFSFRIVTLSGEVVNVGGSLTGGSYSNNYGILSRKNVIERLDTDLKKIDAEILNKENAILELDENILKKDDEYKNCCLLFNSTKNEITEINSKISGFNLETSSLKLQLTQNSKNYEIIHTSIENITAELAKINEEEIDLNEIKSKFEEEADILEEKINNFKDESERARELLIDAKMSKVKIEEMLINKGEIIKRLNREKEDLIMEIDSLNVKLVNLNDEMNKRRIDVSSFEEDSKNLKDECVALADELNVLEINRIKLKEEYKKRKDELDDKNRESSELENEIHKKELIKIKYETEKDNIFKNINEEYGITYAESLSISTKLLNIADTKKDIINLKSKISSLGIVNVASIEEYREVNEKYTFLTNQKIDMMNAKEELNKLISQLTVNMEKIFAQNFNILRKHFSVTFNELFNGGTCDLVIKEGDLLNGDIDIIVEPPFKKLQNINLLSGGEKGLSAIALLFAILKMRPTAFCILDEIDESLDDANVIRFSKYLETLKNKTQFVLITHRKGTMEVSDSIYGITMEEKGISKVISLPNSNFYRD